jgi:glycosyltransferase involved in cell wall biosynthesis
MEKKAPLVTIRCITYNHAPYIRQCLDGFLMQQTTFPFIVIIHDDASTDGTEEILREYAAKYPDIIIPLYEKENQYSKYGHLMTVRKQMDPLIKGKYIALCEGDDYWTDPLKLQKQVDFLESHPEHSMCFHQVLRHHQDTDEPDEPYDTKLEERDYTGVELYTHCRPSEVSVVMRHDVIQSDVYSRFVEEELSFGDIPVFLSCAHCGKVHAMTDTMAVYRMHKGGVSNIFRKPNEKVLKYAHDNLMLYKIFGKEYKKEATRIYVMDYLNFFFQSKKAGELRLGVLAKVLFTHPIYTIQFLYDRYKYSRYHI